MLSEANVQATIPVKNMEEAKHFYGDTLGLPVVKETSQEVVYQSGNSQLEIYLSDNAGTNMGTSATWEVEDIETEVHSLKSHNVGFEKYDALTGSEVDGGSIYEVNGQKAAWFRDPDGNILCLHTSP